MKSETDDPDKINNACRCTNNVIQGSSVDAITQYTKRTYAKYKGTNRNQTAETGVIEKSIDSCMLKAGIDPNSEYKTMYVLQAKESTKQDLAKTNLKMIGYALERYRLKNYKYPTQQQGLNVLLGKSKKATTTSKTTTSYLQTLPKDPWGNEYNYKISGKNQNFKLYSFGRDGKPGGNGFDKDIYFQKY